MLSYFSSEFKSTSLPLPTTESDKQPKPLEKWAVVTGASDGLGAEYSRLLARQGYHIILVSRTLSKLKKIEQEIIDLTKENPVKTKIVEVDFTKKTPRRPVEFYNELFDRIIVQDQN
mmetsp:Transcript_3911/g.5910  ORF Transcript_3911/g.5910 Transcript_3911/m.5910 type:complete len:117 (+) Transcript_3911:147-497(+)